MKNSLNDFEIRKLYYQELIQLKNQISNAITSFRLVILPHLVYSFNHNLTIATESN